MPPAPPAQRMGELHEKFLAELNGGRMTTSSGNQWDDQGDGLTHHDIPYAMAWDGKSTKGKQIAVTRAMVEKIVEEAQGQHPQIGLRWYGNDALTEILHDWVAVPAELWRELLADGREAETLRQRIRQLEAGSEEDSPVAELQAEEIRQLQRSVSSALDQLGAAQSQHEIDQGEIQALKEQRAQWQAKNLGGAGEGRGARPGRIPGYIPAGILPWTVVYQDGGQVTTERYSAIGERTQGTAGTVTVERSLGSSNRPRLVVDNLRIPNGSLYVNGHRVAQVCESRPDLEMG